MLPNTILVVVAHPDDEVLGMGGTIYRATQEGHLVNVLFLSSGVGARESERENAESRQESAKRATKYLGCKEVIFADFPDNSFDSVSVLQISKVIELQIERLRPNIVFTNFYEDLNVDHRMTAEATLVASRPKPSSTVSELYFFEVLSSTGWKFGSKQFSPNYFIDISSFIEQKIHAVREYSIEIEESPHARSIDSILALARARGNFIGFNLAEAFEVGFIRVNNPSNSV